MSSDLGQFERAQEDFKTLTDRINVVGWDDFDFYCAGRDSITRRRESGKHEKIVRLAMRMLENADLKFTALSDEREFKALLREVMIDAWRPGPMAGGGGWVGTNKL